MISIRLLIVVLITAVVHVYASEIAHIDKVKQKQLNKELHDALLHGLSQEIVQKLIEQDGADINGVAEHSIHRTPAVLYAATTRFSDTSMLLYLIGCGADVKGKDNDDFTACHYAASQCGRTDCIRILVKEGADVNAKNKNGSTPLHSACLDGKVNAVEVLLAYGASTQVKNNLGKTPLDIARSGNHTTIVTLLEDYESIPDTKEPEED